MMMVILKSMAKSHKENLFDFGRVVYLRFIAQSNCGGKETRHVDTPSDSMRASGVIAAINTLLAKLCPHR